MKLSSFGQQSGGGVQQPMAPRQLPYNSSQPTMGQNQGGAQGGNATGSVWGSGGAGPRQSQTGSFSNGQQVQKGGLGGPWGSSMQNPQQGNGATWGNPQGGLSPSGPAGGIGGNGGINPKANPMMWQKLMEMIKGGGGHQSPWRNEIGFGGRNADDDSFNVGEPRLDPWMGMPPGGNSRFPQQPQQNPNIGNGTGSNSRDSTDWLQRHPEEAQSPMGMPQLPDWLKPNPNMPPPVFSGGNNGMVPNGWGGFQTQEQADRMRRSGAIA